MHIILLNFDYPPNPGIGGRRWAKLSRELANRGVHVHVVKAKYTGDKISSWSEETHHPNISIYELEPLSRLHKTRSSSPILNSILFRLELMKMKRMDKGTPFDKSIGMKEAFLNTMETIVAKNPISWIIATGAPFNLPYYAAIFKQRHEHIKLWVDCRDPWLHATNYGMNTLSAERYQAEVEKAKFILENTNVISSPTWSALHEFDTIASTSEQEKYYELKHFADIQQAPEKRRPNNDCITITYGGAIYLGTAPFLHQMASDLTNLKANQPSIYNKLRISFFTPDFHKIKKIFEDIDIVTVQEDIGSSIFQQWAISDYALILLADHNKDFFTTKFYECLALKNTLLYLGPQGKVGEEIHSKALGTSWSELIEAFQRGIFLKVENQISDEDLYAVSLSGRVDELLKKMNTL